MYSKFQLSRMIFIFINFYQLSSAVDSWWQLIWKKIYLNFHVPTKVETCAKFQLSRMILIFISCQQLLSAVDNWPAVQNYFWELNSHIGPKTRFYAEFHIDWLIGSRARECDARQTDTNCQTPSEDRANLAMLSWARAWVRQLQTTFKIFWFEYNENWLITCETYFVDQWGEISVEWTNGVMHDLPFFILFLQVILQPNPSQIGVLQ